MKTLFAVLILMFATWLPQSASAVIYSCPSGGSLSGTTCYTSSSYGASVASYYCPSGGSLSGTTCTYFAGYSCPSGGSLSGSTCAVISGYSCPGGTVPFNYAPVNQSTSCYVNCPAGYGSWTSGYGSSWVSNAGNWVCKKNNVMSFIAATQTPSVANFSYYGATANYGTYGASIASYYCPSGGSLSGTTCTISGSYAATATYQCNPGDTLMPGNICRPALLTATATDVYECPVAAGDPVGAGWWLNTQGTTSVTQQSNIAAPLCRFNPPTVNGTYSYTTHHCHDLTHALSGDQLWCIPPTITTYPSLDSIFACFVAADSLSGSTCTPPMQIYASTPYTTYACPTGMPSGTLMDAVYMCVPPIVTQAVIQTPTLTCGPNSKLNTTTNQCDYVSIPALNVGGQYRCPAKYTVGTGANQGWCLPATQWAYPASWYLTTYMCQNGGTLGLNPDGTQNGLCYLP